MPRFFKRYAPILEGLALTYGWGIYSINLPSGQIKYETTKH